MKTNWRELRETLSIEETFNHKNTFNRRSPECGTREDPGTPPLVNSAERVKRSPEANSASMVFMVKSAKSLPDDSELQASLQRLESAHIQLAISEDGDLRIVQQSDTNDLHGFTIYSPQDAYLFIKLSERERRILHEFKRRFGGTVEWTDVDSH